MTDSSAATPEFSIITVCLNDSAGLLSTIASVESQTFASYEHVIMDGGSTDESVEIIRDYAARSSHVRWVSEKDKGIFDAMNKASRLARGQVLLYLNSGDSLSDPGVLRRVHDSRNEQAWKWAYGCLRYVNEKRELVGAAVQIPFRKRRLEFGINFVPHQAMFIDREWFFELGEYDENFPLNSDQDLAIRAAQEEVPGVLTDFVTDFLVGGAHENFTMYGREKSYHLMRKKTDTLFLGSALADRVFFMSVAAFRRLRRIASRFKGGV